MNIEQILMQLINSGDMFAALKTTVLPVVIAVVGHNVLNYMKSVKAGALKKLHDALQAQQVTLKDSTLVEIEEARKKAEAVVVEAATAALTKVLDDFNAKMSLAQTATDAKHEALTVLVSELKAKLDGIAGPIPYSFKPMPDHFTRMLAGHEPYPEVLTNKEDGTHNNEPTESNMHLSKPTADVIRPASVAGVLNTPSQLSLFGGASNLAGPGAPYLETVRQFPCSIASLAMTAGYVDMSKQVGVQFSYTTTTKEKEMVGGSDGSAKFVGQVESVVSGTTEQDKDTTGSDATPVVGV